MEQGIHDQPRPLKRSQAEHDLAASHLLPLVYPQLRGIASAYLRHERRDHTLQPTALVHEAYERLARQQGSSWQDRGQFVAVVATAMRNILIKHARDRRAGKRGGAMKRVMLEDALAAFEERSVDLLALDDALTKLASLDARQAHIVELRFFAGLTVGEVADALAISVRMVERDWALARAWLWRELNREKSP